MTLLTATEMFTIKTWKRAIGNPSYRWSNTYEVDYESSARPTPTQWKNILESFMSAEAVFHTQNVEYVKAVVSSWAPNAPNTPYEPGSFKVVRAVAGTYGQRIIATDPLPRNIALHVSRGVETGLEGKIHYRGVLAEFDLETNSALDPKLSSSATTELQGLLTTFYNDARDLFGTGTTPPYGPANFALISTLLVDGEPATESRAVENFRVVGVSVIKPDHKYYDLA